MNKTILMGRLTADPELRQTQSGISCCRFMVAVNRKIADKQTGKRQADFIPCIAWRQTAEFICRYFRKGSMICVDGMLRTGSYTDRNHSDVTHFTVDLLVENVEFTGNTTNNNQNSSNQTAKTTAKSEQARQSDFSDFEEILSDGELPF